MRAGLSALVEPTRGEPGCLSDELYERASAPGTFVTVELWRAQADLDEHLQTPHVQPALGAAGDALEGARGIHPLLPVTG